ncbi:DUF4393 domain-containing protein [Cetobacterium somerae]|uniref:DUF4393 domain-containing protein n=1 Tax=Cetobacterium somerae TaxID=188913 RepID=UPI0038928BFE
MELQNLTKGVNKIIPKVYEDAIQPTAKVIGQMGETIAKAINTALIPLRLIVWKAEEIENSIKTGLEEKMKNISLDEIQTPNPRIAGPTLEGLRYTAQEKELREMYTSLLANSMNKKVAPNVHPSFPDIIKQLCSEEAKILEFLSYSNPIAKIDIKIFPKNSSQGFSHYLKNFSLISKLSFVENHQKANLYLDNLIRLSLIHIENDNFFLTEEFYSDLINSKEIISLIDETKNNNTTFNLTEGNITLTTFGKEFCNCCIEKKDMLCLNIKTE